MARPRTGQARDRILTIRLTAEEDAALRAAAMRAGQSVSHYARNAALRARPRPGPAAFGFEPGTFFQIRMLGVNLNQIARRLNSMDIPPPPELPPLLAQIRAALEKALPA